MLCIHDTRAAECVGGALKKWVASSEREIVKYEA
jgi:hypothetical protein